MPRVTQYMTTDPIRLIFHRLDTGWTRATMFCGIPLNELNRVNNMASKELPNPVMAYADFIKALLERGKATSLGDFQTQAGKDGRLWVQNVAQHMSEALQHDIVVIAPVKNAKDEKVHGYIPTPDAITFWQNGVEQGLTAEQILQGWKAMMSLGKGQPDPDANT